MLAKASNIALPCGSAVEIGVLEQLEDAYGKLQDGVVRINTITGLMVTVKTSSDFGSGTDGDVIFKMETTHGSVEKLLDKRFYNDFEMFDRTYMDNFINRDEGLGIRRLQVVIKTSDDMWSGTDDNVYMEIKFDDSVRSHHYCEGKHRVYLNTRWHNDFEIGDIDTFNICLPERVQKSSIKSFEFYKKGSDDWKIEWIKISDLETGEVLCYEQSINRKLKLSGERLVISSGYWNDPV
ncbi:MAG TPA: PLAT/LH2 domain-containing protein [Acetivibrio sp.]|uniref:PLAT/LH2 domain-containing protein n=1 Tax=Acetivibrio sp. TaxID=1872092 RepID=UPI002B837CEC|nr:PLAT/LH2 domain-containing protein [Acetivibrio sp.]HOM01455.1 PLAT/LH2 domain-containing protein [Acetivibrio sp.]